MKKSTTLIPMLLAMLVMILILWSGCQKNEEETPPPAGPGAEDYQASGTVSSDTNGVITTATGAKIVVPEGAVPLTTSGTTGTMVFSIERNTSLTITPPQGETVASDVYRFGPDGFILAAQVEIAIPVLGEDDPAQVRIYRINPTTGEYEPFGGVYDEETRTVSTQTYELSSWFITYPDTDNEWDWGCIHVINTSTEYWVRICFDSVNFRYPERDANYTYLNCLLAPFGHIGTDHELLWPVPQGDYVLCVEFHPEGPSEEYEFYDSSYTVQYPWNRVSPTPVQFTATGPRIPQNLGRCECNPFPTPSVGTGDVQVTLIWYNLEAIDLDLWVTDPDSEVCNWQNPLTESGGELDRDNLCWNYINGRAENIFWSDAPAGQYIVQVDWYWDCDNEITSQSFNVRVYANGQARTYNGTITTDQTVEVTRFTVSGPTVIFGPQINRPVASGARPPKN